MTPDATFEWAPLSPEEVGELFEAVDARWWIAGGWAIDLFLGQLTRHHGDIDIEIARRDLPAIATELQGWDLQLARGGRFSPWHAGQAVPDGFNSLWCREHASCAWQLQIMLADVTAGYWRYRRDTRIHLAIDELGWLSADGLPVLQPQIQLLYKSRNRRTKDDEDFHRTLSHLAKSQREWLRAALETASPDCDWLEKFSAS